MLGPIKILTIVLTLIALSGCGILDSITRNTDYKESKKEASTATAKTESQQIKSTPLIDARGARNTRIDLKLEGPLPLDRFKTDLEKMATDDTMWTMSFSELYKKFSAIMYIILLVCAWGAWILFTRITRSKEFKFLAGSLKALGSVARSVNETMLDLDPKSEEWSALNKIKHKIGEKEKYYSRVSNPKDER